MHAKFEFEALLLTYNYTIYIQPIYAIFIQKMCAACANVQVM